MKTSAAFPRAWVRRPMFLMAAGMVVVVATEFWRPGNGWITALGFSGLLAAAVSWRIALVGAGLALVTLVNIHLRESRQRDGEAWIAKQGLRTVEARLVEDARGYDGNWGAVAKLHGTGLKSRRVIWKGAGDPPPAGTEIKATGVFKPLVPERNPGAPDWRERQRAEGVLGSFHSSEMREQRWIGPISRKKADFKIAFREGIVAGLDEEGTPAMVIRAVVLGEKSPDSLELVRDFRESGTLHVFTVSGLHVAMVGSLLWALLRISGCPRRWAVPAIIAVMFGYVWLTGNGAAAVRAAWMGSVFLLAFALRRRSDLLNALGAVLLFAILWNPGILRLPGVQLSYGVVAAIGIGTAIARRCFGWIAEGEELLPKSELSWWQARWLSFRQKLATGFAVSLAASVGSTPLSMFHFGIVTPVSVLATVALVAQVYVLLAVALISAIAYSFWPEASVFLNRKNAWVATACAETAGAFAKIPGGWAMTTSPDEETLVIYDLDYGAGAACFAAPGTAAVMIDSGGKFNLRGEVAPSLKNLGMNPDAVVFTHADAGHVAPADLMIEMFPIRQVAMGTDRTNGSVAASWEKIGEPEMKVARPRGGDVLDFGNGVSAKVLLSPHDFSVGSVADDRVLVFMLRWRGWNILWLGDAGRLSEQELLASGMDLRADLIVAGFHETDFSLTDAFLSAVEPQVLILPRLPGSQMDVYRIAQREQWLKEPFRIIDRQETGGLTLTIGEDGDLVIAGFLDGSEMRLKVRH